MFVVLCGCKSHKQTIHVDETIDWSEYQRVRDSLVAEWRKSEEERLKATSTEVTEEEEVVYYYDTTLPIDSATGKHPLEKEVHKSKKTKKSDDVESVKVIEEESTQEEHRVEDNGVDATIEDTLDFLDERKQRGSVKWTFIGFVSIFAFIAIICWLVRKWLISI